MAGLDGTGICDGSTAHRRFQQWREAGVFDALWEQALRDYEQDVGIDWSWLSIDGSMGKARWEAGKPPFPHFSRVISPPMGGGDGQAWEGVLV